MKEPDIGRVIESYFNLPNEKSNSIIPTDSDFILADRTCSIAITADMSFRTALATDFKRQYKNIEFLWKQRPGGVATLPPAASRIPGKTASQGSQIRTCEHVSIYQPGVSGEQAAITPWNVASEFRRLIGESLAKFENLMDHYGDGIRRYQSSPAVSDGGVGEPRQNRGHNDSKLGFRRSPMGANVEKVSVRGTDRLHHTDEHENAVIHR